MNSGNRRRRSISERIMDLDSPNYGDERERAVVNEAASYGFSVGTYANLVVALVAAVLGALALPAVLLVLTSVPALAAMAWAKRRGVDMEELAARGGPLSRLGPMVVVFAGVLLTIAAMGFTVFSGHGLVTIPVPDVTGPAVSGGLAGMARGAVVGALIGGVGGFVWLLIGLRRRARKAAEAPTEDEDA